MSQESITGKKDITDQIQRLNKKKKLVKILTYSLGVIHLVRTENFFEKLTFLTP